MSFFLFGTFSHLLRNFSGVINVLYESLSSPSFLSFSLHKIPSQSLFIYRWMKRKNVEMCTTLWMSWHYQKLRSNTPFIARKTQKYKCVHFSLHRIAKIRNSPFKMFFLFSSYETYINNHGIIHISAPSFLLNL